jgi:hypothetical protein
MPRGWRSARARNRDKAGDDRPISDHLRFFMPPLKGLACVSLLTLAIAAPQAFAQSSDTAPPAPGSSTTSPSNPSTAPGAQQSGQKTGKHRRRSQNSSATQGQPSTTPSDQR